MILGDELSSEHAAGHSHHLETWANSTQAWLAKAKARIMGEISTTILHFF